MAVETLRPTANVANALMEVWGTPSAAYDGNASTSATGSASAVGTGPDSQTDTAELTVKQWQSPTYQAYYSALTLKVTYSVTASKVVHNGGAGTTPWSISYSVNGGFDWTELVSGGSSHAQDAAIVSLPVGTNIANLQVRANIEANGSGSETATWNINISMPVFDVWTEGTYTPPPPPPPPVPTGLAATAGDAQITLSWNASSGATAYHIRRSDTPLIIIGVLSPGYIDTGLINGTEYTYTVTAVNEGGESSAAGPVSATPAGPPPPVVHGGSQAVWVGF